MKKLILIFLAAVMLLPLASCKKDQNSSDGEGNTLDVEEQYYLNTLPADMYSFDSIKIATIDSNMTLESPPEDADSVDVRKYYRDYTLEEYFGIDIQYYEIQNGVDTEEAEFMLNLVLTDGSDIDSFIQQPDNLMYLAINGACTDLNLVKNIELSNEWWSQSMNDNLTFNGSLYVTAGPVAEWYYGAVLAMAYNKDMANNYGIGSIYDMVDNGTWTLETMKTILTDHSLTNAEEGRYAIAFSSGVGPYGLFASAGGKFATIDDEDGIVVDLASSKHIDIMEKILETFDPAQTKYGNVTVSTEPFTSGKSMFYYTTVGYMENFLPSSEVNYGIIPCPKYDTTQQEYISCAWPSSSFAVAIPNYLSEDRLGWTGLFLEAYCFLGYDYIKPVKYDALVKYQIALDATSSRMLDTIFGNIYFDINLVANLGGSRTFIGNAITQGMGGYTGSYLGISGLIDRDIAKFDNLTKEQ